MSEAVIWVSAGVGESEGECVVRNAVGELRTGPEQCLTICASVRAIVWISNHIRPPHNVAGVDYNVRRIKQVSRADLANLDVSGCGPQDCERHKAHEDEQPHKGYALFQRHST